MIFDYSQFMDVRNDSLELAPANTDGGLVAHLRILIDDVTKEQQSQLLELTRRLHGEKETDRSERVTIVRQPFRMTASSSGTKSSKSTPRRNPSTTR